MTEETEAPLAEAANRLAREAVKAEMAQHTVEMLDGKPYCSICWNDCGQLMWPCPTVETLSDAAEAINVAEEEEERVANGPYLCGVETRAARMYEDPEPAEYCENEVAVEGEPCARHGGADEPDYDAIRKDRKLEEGD